MDTPTSPDGKWHYLVVFDLHLDGGGRAVGNGEIVQDGPIRTYQDTMEAKERLSIQYRASAVITNLVLLSAP